MSTAERKEQIRLRIVPCELKTAKEFITAHHRHHKPPQGHRFSLAVVDELGVMHGVATVGRPVARMLQDGLTVEVTRVATDGTPNACSALYGAARRAARALGYRRLVTYTLQEESGTSLKASGWRLVGEAGGGTWNRASRERTDKHPTQLKRRWEVAI